MQWLRDLSLRQKLFLGILATCMTAMLVGASALFWFQSVTFQTAFVAEVKALSAMVARNSTAPLIFGDRRSGAEVLQSFKVKPQVLHAQIVNERGELFAQIGSEPTQWPWRDHLGTEPILIGKGYARLTLPLPIDDSSQGRLEVIAYYGDEQKKLFSLFGSVMAGIFIVSLMVILVMSNLIQRLITRPIISLVDLAQNITEKEEYHKRAVEQSRDEVGVLTRAFNQMLDRVQSRDAGLRESQQRYEVAVLGSSDGLWDHDLVHGQVYFAPRWKAMIGYEDHELTNTGETFLALLHPDDLPAVTKNVSAYLNGDVPTYEAEFRMRHKEGSYRWILSRGAALRNENNQPIRFAGSHTDITERKLVELEIRVAREKFEVLVNSIDGVVWEACIETRSFTFVSPQAERLLGYPLKQWTENRTFWIDHLHPADRENTLRVAAEAIAKRQATRSEYRIIAADGREVWIRNVASVLESAEGKLVLRGVFFDISEQKKSELELDQLNQKLREASREAGMAEIATGVLHNVGNVLNSVNVSASLVAAQIRKSKSGSLTKGVALLQEHRDDLGTFFSQDPRARQLPTFFQAVTEQILKEQSLLSTELQSLQQNIDHIKQIVAMQQSFARVGGAIEGLHAHELMEDALKICSSGLTRHQVEVSREFQVVPTVLVDRHKVLQILVNLITNAKQALESRESQRKILLRIHTLDRIKVRMEVVDNGMGIPADALTRIFQHGFTTKKTGHGFGLHSGANAAKELGGSLQAYSEGPGLGARFVLEVPVTPTPPSALPPNTSEPPFSLTPRALFSSSDPATSPELAPSSTLLSSR